MADTGAVAMQADMLRGDMEGVGVCGLTSLGCLRGDGATGDFKMILGEHEEEDEEEEL